MSSTLFSPISFSFSQMSWYQSNDISSCLFFLPSMIASLDCFPRLHLSTIFVSCIYDSAYAIAIEGSTDYG